MTNSKNHSNLYITNIPPEVDQESLNQVFASYGAVTSCRLVRNQKNPMLNSYGFVKMGNISEADLVIEKLNGATLNGSILEVKYANDDSGDKNQANLPNKNDNLYVRNLPSVYTESDVHTLFGPFGQIKDLKVLPSGDAERGNGALIRMNNSDEAQAAIQALHNTIPAGGNQQMHVRYADTAQDKARKSAGQTKNKVTPQQQQMGYNNYPSQQLVYVNGQAFPLVVDPLTGQQTLGTQLVGYNNNNSQQQLSSVYVCNLPPEADKLTLYEMFNEFGGVKNVRVLQDEEGKCKGVGFVNYVDLPSAQKAIQARNGYMIGDREILCNLQQKKK